MTSNIPILEYTSPLNSLQIYTTEKFILDAYVSIEISIKTDTDSNLNLEFSGDGRYWDIQTTYSILSGQGKSISSPCKAKWCRIQITNTSLSNQTYLRLYTLGCTSNTSLQAELSKIGNISPTVAVDNLPLSRFGELMTASFHSSCNYKWDYIQPATPPSMNFTSPYEWDYDLYYNDLGNADPHISNTADCLELLSTEVFLNTEYSLRGRYLPYSSGVAIQSRFTSAFSQPSVLGGLSQAQRQLVGVGNFVGAKHNELLRDCFAVGYYEFTATEPQVVWLKDRAIISVVSQSQWNKDKCDGTGSLPVIDFSKINIYKIDIGYLGVAGGLISIYYDNAWYPIHEFRAYNNRSETQFKYSSMCNFALVAVGTQSSVSKDGYIRCGSWALGEVSERHENPRQSCLGHIRSGLTGNNNYMFSLYNPDSTTNFLGKPNLLISELVNLSVAITGTNNSLSKVSIYRNLVINTPTWTVINTRTPVLYDNLGTAIIIGQPIYEILISQDGSAISNLNSYREQDKGAYQFQPGTSYTVVASSSATCTCEVSLSIHQM